MQIGYAYSFIGVIYERVWKNVANRLLNTNLYSIFANQCLQNREKGTEEHDKDIASAAHSRGAALWHVSRLRLCRGEAYFPK